MTIKQIRLAARPQGLSLRAPRTALNRWDKSISMASKVATNELSIMTEIGPEEWGLTSAKSVQKLLKSFSKGPVVVTINSPGGDAFDGIAIFNLLRDFGQKVTTRVLGMAASAASVITMAGDTIEMGEASMLMIHSASGMVYGNEKDLTEFADVLRAIDESVADLYASRTGLKVSEILEMMRKETWMSAKDAVKHGFADKLISEKKDDKKKSTTKSSALSTAFRPAALGTSAGFSARMSANPPGDSGFNQPGVNMDLRKVIADLTAKREEKVVRMGEITEMLKKGHDEVSAEDRIALRAEFDELDDEMSTIEDELRDAQFQLRSSQAARPVMGTSSRSGTESRRPMPKHTRTTKDEKFPGQFFTQMVIAKALAHLHMTSPVAVAQRRFADNQLLIDVIRMANEVPGAGSGAGEWGNELVQADARYTGDFIEYLYSKTVFDKLPLRPVPAHVTIKGTDGAATAYWVGESKAIPATQGSASSVSLTPLKVAAVAVVSNELIRDASPSAEQWVRDLLVEASAQRVDQTFLSTSAAVAGVSPAGILNGVSAGSSAGTDGDGVRTDLEILASNFIQNKNASGLALITSTGLALAMQLLRNALGQREFPEVRMDGGSLEGMPLVTGDNVGSGDVIMLKPTDIWKIDDRGISVEISREATIEMNSAPSGETDTPTAAANTLNNMFQTESTAIKIVRPINFQKRRSHAVAYIGDAGYGGVAS